MTNFFRSKKPEQLLADLYIRNPLDANLLTYQLSSIYPFLPSKHSGTTPYIISSGSHNHSKNVHCAITACMIVPDSCLIVLQHTFIDWGNRLICYLTLGALRNFSKVFFCTAHSHKCFAESVPISQHPFLSSITMLKKKKSCAKCAWVYRHYKHALKTTNLFQDKSVDGLRSKFCYLLINQRSSAHVHWIIHRAFTDQTFSLKDSCSSAHYYKSVRYS